MSFIQWYPELKDRISKINYGDQFKPKILRKLFEYRHYAIKAPNTMVKQIRNYYFYYRFHQSSVGRAYNYGGFPCRKTLEKELKFKIKRLYENIVYILSISLLLYSFYYSFKYLYLNGIYKREMENQIRYHQFIELLVKRNNTKYMAENEKDIKNQLINRHDKSNLIIEIYELKIVYILFSIGMLLSFAVFFIEIPVFANKIK